MHLVVSRAQDNNHTEPYTHVQALCKAAQGIATEDHLGAHRYQR